MSDPRSVQTRPAVDGYDVRGLVGSGALSTVYEAIRLEDGRQVAIKALKPSIPPSSPFAAQFAREARALGALDHPGVVKLLDFVQEAQRVHLVLEFVAGASLHELTTRKPKPGLEASVSIGLETARALEHVHARGVVHRDVKPGNLIVDRHGHVKLVDFGLATLATRDAASGAQDGADAGEPARVEATFGTPAYMAPEQILGEAVDARADLFSLGVVLYQLLSGTRPFEARGEGNRRAAAQRIRRDAVTPLRRHAPEVPKALERLVMSLLEKLPADRVASASVVVERLEGLSDELRGDRRGPPAVRAALRSAGFAVTGEDGEGGEAAAKVERAEATASRFHRPSRLAPRTSLSPFVAVFALIVAGGTTIQLAARGKGGEAARATGGPLELVPSRAGYLRVLATPWAYVFVDGQQVETTPFAKPVPLAPGYHDVTFRHPDAPEEERKVEIRPGETVTMDVTMRARLE